jgi:DNA-binding MarR family transcriptional regulator
MTTSPASPDEKTPVPDVEPIAHASTADHAHPDLHDELGGTPSGDLSAQLIRLIRLINSVKVHAAAKQRHGVEFSSYVLLFQLVRTGPQRLSSLAECVHADASTVSRQVSTLVEHGLVEKRPDELDRRAALLAATDAGLELFRRMRRERNAMFNDVLDSWTTDEITTLTSSLARFNDDFAAHHQHLLGRAAPTDAGDADASGVPPDTPSRALHPVPRPDTDLEDLHR